MIPDREKYVNLEDVKITLHNTDSLGKAAWDVIDLPYIVPPKWIPVTERLPETSGKVLITRRIGLYVGDDYDRCVDLGYYYSSLKLWDTLDLDDTEVLAWMPLPEPYEGGD